MGFLTTFTIYNDGVDQLRNNSNQLIEALNDATSGIQIRQGRNWAGIGNNTNLLTLQKPRHADDHTLYMHAGNTVVDVYNADSDWARDQFIIEMEYHLKRLKQIKKEKMMTASKA